MTIHNYAVRHGISEYNFSGLHSTKQYYLLTVHQFKPTVDNVKQLAKELFPEYEIDLSMGTIKEQIASGYDIGLISIHFKSNDEFINHSMILYEIF